MRILLNMSRLWMAGIFVVCALSIAWAKDPPAQSQSSADFLRRADEAAQNLGRRRDFTHVSRGDRAEIRQLYRDTLSLMDEITETPLLTDPIRDRLLETLTTKMGDHFYALTSPYVDPIRWPDIRPFSDTRGLGKVVWPFYRTVQLSWFGVQSLVGRDLATLFWPRWHGRWMMPPAFPIFGSDTLRSALAARIAKDIRAAFDRELKQAKELKVPMTPGAKALLRTIEAMGKSEPMRYGWQNRAMWWMYLGAGIAFFFYPPVEPFWEVTGYSPLVAGTLYTLGGILMATTRTRNSGLKSYITIRKLLKKAARCQK